MQLIMMVMKQHLLSIALIIALSSAIYLNTLKNGFVYDDEITIVENTLIKDIGNLRLLFDKTDYFAHSAEKSYRPVVTFTYFIDHALYGLKPWGYHLTNLLLHAVNGVLLYTFLILLFKQSFLNSPATRNFLLNNPPMPITLLFVTHPVLTEAVNTVSYREDLLAFFFYITTLALYLFIRSKFPDNRATIILTYITSCMSYLFAILSKEMALTLPLIVYSLDWVYSNGKGKAKIVPNRYSIGYIAITIICFYIFYNPPRGIIRWAITERFLTAPWLILKYLFLLLAPVNLSAEYMISPIKSISSFPFITSFLIVISALTIAFILLKREKNVSFGIIFFVVALIPVLNLASIGNPFAERYLYLPTVGFSIIAWIVIAHLFKKKKPHFLLTTFLILLAIYSLAVIKRNAVWKDNLSLWSDTVKKVPESDRVHNNLGIEYEKRNRLDDAEQHYKAALRLTPDFPEAYTNLSLVYLRRGWLDGAQQAAISALKLNPNYMYAHYNLGLIYIKMGLKDEARKEFETTLKLSPNDRGAQKILETLE